MIDPVMTSPAPRPDAAAPARRGGRLAWVGVAARAVLGGVLLAAGLLKVGALGESVNAVMAYRILPYELVAPVGVTLPFVEIVLGALLLAGLYTRLAGLGGALLMAAFIVGIASAWARGLALDCGCFGGGGEIDAATAFGAYPWEIARDVGLLACGAWLVAFPRTPWAVDNLRLPPVADHDADAEPAASPRVPHPPTT